MCDAPANKSSIWKNPGFIHSAILNQLQPNTQYFYLSYSSSPPLPSSLSLYSLNVLIIQCRYFYKFGSSGASGWSEVFSFISPNPKATEAFVVAFGGI